MEYGYYDKPKNRGALLKKPIKKKPKIACVITTHFSEIGRLDYPYTWAGAEPGVALNYRDDKLANFRFALECHKHYKPGIPYDIIIVDNASSNVEAQLVLNDSSHIIRYRENDGFSFGGYKYAWEQYGDEYDYYIFHEQDCAPVKNGWLKELYDIFNSDKAMGALGNVVEYRSLDEEFEPSEHIRGIIESQLELIKSDRDHAYSLDGTFTFTSSEVLNEVDKFGGLQVLSGGIDVSTINEIYFSQPVLEAGFKLASIGSQDFDNSEKLFTYGMRKGNFNRKVVRKALSPIMEITCRYLCEEMYNYFNKWYEKENAGHLAELRGRVQSPRSRGHEGDDKQETD